MRKPFACIRPKTIIRPAKFQTSWDATMTHKDIINKLEDNDQDNLMIRESESFSILIDQQNFSKSDSVTTLHDNRIFLFFLQFRCQFHPFLRLLSLGMFLVLIRWGIIIRSLRR